VKIILGISAFYHDSAATLLKNGKIIAAAQEERFTRVKHDSNYPFNAIEFVLKYSKLKLTDVDKIVFFEKPFLKFERLLETYVALAPKGFKSFCAAMPIWLKDKLFQKKMIFNKLKNHDKNFNDIKKIHFSEHHLSHAASAFFPSPFENAIVLTADGVGEWATTTVAIGKKNQLKIIKEIHFPHSLGLLYSAFTYYLGFKVNSGEYKMMGLAPYGSPKYIKKIKNLIDIKEDGSFSLDLKYFDFATGLKMTNSNFHNLFGAQPRKSDEEITQFHMDVAASIQFLTEEILIKLLKSLKKNYKIDNLCLAGGVALNCVANGKIYNEKLFENIWVQPAAGDAGGSLGAALAMWYSNEKNLRDLNQNDDLMKGSFLGPEYSQKEIELKLNELGAKFQILQTENIISKTVLDLVEGKAIGWFQGRMEFGPRALGNRSIIADARSASMQRILNLKVKYRESFRPFAPSILKEHLSNWFEFDKESPYMLFVGNIKNDKKIQMTENEKNLFGIKKLNIKRSNIPAVTHVDYSARIQTVTKDKNGMYYSLIKKFYDETNCPLVINTSFNVRGEPIVNTPEDAFRCFMGTELDTLVIGKCVLDKKKQDKALMSNYVDKFELD
jgi:carbamoyltransferase